jgi:hypothetical protein
VRWFLLLHVTSSFTNYKYFQNVEGEERRQLLLARLREALATESKVIKKVERKELAATHVAPVSTKVEEEEEASTPVMLGKIEWSSITDLRHQLEGMGIDTRTPGARGDERRKVLEARLLSAVEANQPVTVKRRGSDSSEREESIPLDSVTTNAAISSVNQAVRVNVVTTGDLKAEIKKGAPRSAPPAPRSPKAPVTVVTPLPPKEIARRPSEATTTVAAPSSSSPMKAPPPPKGDRLGGHSNNEKEEGPNTNSEDEEEEEGTERRSGKGKVKTLKEQEAAILKDLEGKVKTSQEAIEVAEEQVCFFIHMSHREPTQI